MTTTNDNLINRTDLDGKTLTVDMVTGVVGRYMYDYFTHLKTPLARQIFLSEVCIVASQEIAAFIKGCNRASERKNLTDDHDRRIAALRYAGVLPVPIKPAKPHGRGCSCMRCVKEHLAVGCRSVHCKTCGF